MITNRKGLSDVVTTVLIILLVLAAVVIVGNYVLQLVQKGGEKISSANACGSVPVITPINCLYTTGTTVSLTLTAKKSGNNADIKGLKIILAKADGTTTPTSASTIPKYLETTGVVTLAGSTSLGLPADVYAKNFKKVSVAATINDSAQTVCPQSKEIDCIG